MPAASSSSTGARRLTASRAASTRAPPAPTVITGPALGSRWTASTSSASGATSSSTITPPTRSAPNAARAAAQASAAAGPASPAGTPTRTAPAAALCTAPRQSAFTTTAPSSPAAATAAGTPAGSAATARRGEGMPRSSSSSLASLSRSGPGGRAPSPAAGGGGATSARMARATARMQRSGEVKTGMPARARRVMPGSESEPADHWATTRPSRSPAAAAMPSASSSDSRGGWSPTTTTTPSTAGSPASTPSARPRPPGSATTALEMSTGFMAAPKSGTTSPSPATVAGASGGMARPFASAASARAAFIPPEAPATARLRPGRGAVASRWAVSSRSS